MKISLVAVVVLLLTHAAIGRSEMSPRVFMTAREVASARTGRTRTVEEAILRETLLARARQALETPMRYTVPGNPDMPLPEYKPWPTERDSEMLLIRKDAADTDALAVAYAITGERAYADKAWDNVRVMLSTYKAFGSYHPHRENNDLAAAHAFMALATTWDLCADTAPGEVRDLVLTEGVRRARYMYNTAVGDWKLNGLPVPFDTPGVPGEKKPYNRNIFSMLTTNHCWVDVALLGCLSLALEHEDISGAGPGSGPKDWLRFAIHFFDYIAGIMPPDGSYPESRVYGAPYAFEGSMPFFLALKKVRGIDLFSKNRFFHNFAYGRLYAVWNHPGHGGIANFGEGWGHEWHSAAWIYALAAAYRDPVLQWSADCWTLNKPATDETAWQYLAYDPALSAKRPESRGLPGAIILDDVSHIHIRGGDDPWGENDRVLSFRGSIAGKRQYELKAHGKLPYIQTWHMHQSRNAVELAVNGKPLIWRNTDFEDSTRHYSVLEVNGLNQIQPADPLPGVTDFEATDGYVTFSSEIGGAYPDLDYYRRRVVCVEPGLYVIADHAAAGIAARMDFRLHFGNNTESEFVPTGENSRILVTGSHEGVPFSCTILAPDKISANLEEAAGENASKTLRYGPSDAATGYRVMAVIRLGDSVESVQSAGIRSGELMGAVFSDGARPLVIVFAMDGAMGYRAAPAYSVPATETATRHLLTGLPGSSAWLVKTKLTDGFVSVEVASGEEVTASARGTLQFDISPDGKVTPVHARPQKSAQDVAAELAERGN
jgi:hypothetical protein